MSFPLPGEHTISIIINGIPVQRLICTDELLPELIYGYLYNEGYIDSLTDIKDVIITSDHSCAEILLEKFSAPAGIPVRLSGFAGASRGNRVLQEKSAAEVQYDMDYILSCVEKLEEQAKRYAPIRGIHCSALFNPEEMLIFCGDIGRHNTIDKVAGGCLLNSISTEDTLLVTTGRISEDMVKKAANLKVSLIASYTTATREALIAAENYGIRLIGYVCSKNFQLYCGDE